MTSVYSLGTSTDDVQNLTDVQRHPLQSDVESTSLTNLGTTENPISCLEDHCKVILTEYSPSNPLDSGMYRYVWENYYEYNEWTECHTFVSSYGHDWSDERNEEENREREYNGGDPEDESSMFFGEFWSNPTDHLLVRQYIHETLEYETNAIEPNTSVLELLLDYYHREEDDTLDDQNTSSIELVNDSSVKS